MLIFNTNNKNDSYFRFSIVVKFKEMLHIISDQFEKVNHSVLMRDYFVYINKPYDHFL